MQSDVFVDVETRPHGILWENQLRDVRKVLREE
jgi:hypothetical protein